MILREVNAPRPLENALSDVMVSSSSLNISGLFCSFHRISVPPCIILLNFSMFLWLRYVVGEAERISMGISFTVLVLRERSVKATIEI
jgi:hypothetical protein